MGDRERHYFLRGYDDGYREGQKQANEVLTDRLARAVPPLTVKCGGELLDCPIHAENKRLREGLEKIANPVEYLKREARKEGAQLNGAMAVALSNDVSWLKGIAREALKGCKA